MNCEILSRLESKIRATAVSVLPPQLLVKAYSSGRKKFLEKLVEERGKEVQVPKSLERVCWGKTFRSPIFNASGMFKNGEGYEMTAREGAGAFLAGTSTATARSGNVKDGFTQPFAPYPKSGAASNWLGLPNPGDKAVAQKLKNIVRIPGCPVGASIGADPGLQGAARLEQLIVGLNYYAEARVDFIELNESCPNTTSPSDNDELHARLESVAEKFLQNRGAGLPVIVKLSNDLDASLLPQIMELIVSAGFDGINFGNTSTQYAGRRESIAEGDRRLYDFFTSTFGGGVSGHPLAADSMRLSRAAVEFVRAKNLSREFHVIRTGGVATMADVRESLAAGISLVQWFGGYFERFAADGHRIYERLYAE